ncbi:MAG TPA: cyclodeaminase/cyclohydrolase family protein [Patescibacteria group bacterium]|nr:cyclodeaminase/cyclohydrolase family protein [Patescibacteria group bacterium]
MIKEQKISKFLKDLSSSMPTPGGGSAAAFVGAMGASLVEMVANLTIGKKGYEKSTQKIKEIKIKAVKNKNKLINLADKDAKAFEDVVLIFKLPKGNKRDLAMQKALKKATLIPLETALSSSEVVKLAKEIFTIGNKNAKSDAASALHFAKASASSALENVKINLDLIKDNNWKVKIEKEINKIDI